MKESRHVKSKIVAGYAILIALCLPAVGYVYRQTERLTTPDGSFAPYERKRRTINRTLYHLYQAESYGQLMIAGYRSYDVRYRSELETVRGCLDSLRGFVGADDERQRMRLDSIARLIDDKERRTMSLRQEIRAAGTASLLDRNITELIETVDTVAALRPAEVVRTDTTRIERRKRRLLRRIADIFSPPKEDSSVVISREITRAEAAAAERDTIVTVLRTLQDRVTADRMDIYAKAWDEGARLRYGNRLINEKIYRLIEEFETEATDLMLQRIAATEALKRRSSRILGAIAIGAVLLVLLFVAILWRDIDRSNRYKRALERADREKAKLLEAREKLMLAITHDIKAPLGAIMGYIDLLSRIAPEKRQQHYLHNMRQSADHLHALTESLLDFLRLDTRKVESQRVLFRPATLFATIGEAFAPAARSKGLALHTSIADSARQEVAGDAFRIRQIADNLISNALKFTDAGEVRIGVAVERGTLLFSVRDTGRGIDRTERAAVFGEFTRLRSAQGVEGFGLGLSIVDRLVKLLHGRIWFESRPGAGTRFSVASPVERPDAKAADAADGPAGSAAPAPAPQQTLRVLAVDDDPLQLEMTAAMCRDAGIEATCCPYPEQAAGRVSEERVDLVLTDIQMPGCDGFGLLAAIRAVHPTLPVAAVTARADERSATYIDSGFAALLHKPFSQAELLQAIRTATGTAVATPSEAPRAAAPQEPDFGALTAYAGDDAEAARRILASFAEETAANRRRLAEALARNDAEAVRAAAHKMRPILAMLGAEELAATLREAECGDPTAPALRSALERSLAGIDRMIARAEQALQALPE